VTFNELQMWSMQNEVFNIAVCVDSVPTLEKRDKFFMGHPHFIIKPTEINNFHGCMEWISDCLFNSTRKVWNKEIGAFKLARGNHHILISSHVENIDLNIIVA
jgi:hypothetical protein